MNTLPMAEASLRILGPPLASPDRLGVGTAALEDATQTYEWLLEEGHPPSAVLLAGDSAGGGLVLCLLLHLRERGLPLAAAAICYSPWTDLAL